MASGRRSDCSTRWLPLFAWTGNQRSRPRSSIIPKKLRSIDIAEIALRPP